ncbi:response regulator receiver protein [Caldithrix abyssi DSM 13497]|uniref:Response regulator receiver protein n=1 Tax=Caldithrix abyssi DSM 13497 TaxID=880073 RepID=H1XPB6_CALAY|nr:response regulator [Caldithrix abyssi]APF18204.1 two-component system, chemotaxis family, response regulator CheY [Caldithrix abyssi DSM 13497]EHO42231.1 response regulator receiver protein [Caldithrix abyssi DSM 13497]
MFEDKRILFVEDSPTMRRIIANSLKQLGVKEFEEAQNGLDALEKLHEAPFDLLVTDWNMPEMNGKELVEEVRKLPRFKELPIMMITTRGMEEDVLTAIQVGVNAYIIKPFTPEILRKKIMELFNKS